MGGVTPLVLLLVFVVGTLLDSGRQSRVILLPDADGTVGAVEVVSPAGRTVLNEAGQMTQVSGAAAPTPPEQLDVAAVEREYAAVFAIEPPQPARFNLYFEPGSTELTPESEPLLVQIYHEIGVRKSFSIGVYGHSDRTGSDDYNLHLSLQRAEAIRDLLMAHGVGLESIDVDSHGEGNPLIPTADGVAEPRNRRVEVIVR